MNQTPVPNGDPKEPINSFIAEWERPRQEAPEIQKPYIPAQVLTRGAYSQLKADLAKAQGQAKKAMQRVTQISSMLEQYQPEPRRKAG